MTADEETNEETVAGDGARSAVLACGVLVPFVGLEAASLAGADFKFPGGQALPGLVFGEMALMGLSQLLGQGFAWTLGKLLGRAFPLLGDILSVAIFALLHVIPIRGKRASEWACWYFTNLLDAAADGGPRLSRASCPAGHEPPPFFSLDDSHVACLRSLAAQATPEGSTPRSHRFDVTGCFGELLDRFKPVEYRYDDDLRAITLPELLKHGRVLLNGQEIFARVDRDRTDDTEVLNEYVAALAAAGVSEPGDGSPPAVLAVDEDYAHGETPAGCDETVYARVTWERDDNPSTSPTTAMLVLEFAHLRAGDWLPTRYLYTSSEYHDGDGESAFVIVIVNLQDKRGWIAGTHTGGHGGETWCPDRVQLREQREPPGRVPVEFDHRFDPPRPVFYIGHGSHSIAPEPGMRAAGGGTTDWFPPRIPANRIDNLAVIKSDPLIRAAFFTKKVQWGAAPGAYKGKDPFDPPTDHPNCTGGCAPLPSP